MTGRWDFIHIAESRKRTESHYALSLPLSTTIAEALAAAYKSGMPKGSARSGCIEVQNDAGIYRHIRGMRIDPSTPRKAANIIFKTWEELEHEDT